MTRFIGWFCGKILEKIVTTLALSRIHPNVLTFIGLLINVWAATSFAAGRFQKAAWIVLGHLSESNNAPELARLAAEQALVNHPTLLGNRILLADQATPLDPICL